MGRGLAGRCLAGPRYSLNVQYIILVIIDIDLEMISPQICIGSYSKMIPFLNPLLQNCTEIFTITQSRHGARMKIPKISFAICIIVRFKSNIENFSLPKLGFSDPKTTSKSSKKSLHFCAEKVLKI